VAYEHSGRVRYIRSDLIDPQAVQQSTERRQAVDANGRCVRLCSSLRHLPPKALDLGPITNKVVKRAACGRGQIVLKQCA
jgi:hypothetical protein